MKNYPKDTSAHAVVINEYGTSRIAFDNDYQVQITYEYHTKIKFFDSKEFDREGKFDIPVYNSNNVLYEDVRELKGITFYKDEKGFVQQAELDPKKVIREVESKHWSMLKFAMPGLRNGCVIESYIPKINSVYEVHIPGFWNYNASLRGFLKLTKNESRIEKACLQFGNSGYNSGASADCSDIIYGISDLTDETDILNGAKKKFTKEWRDIDYLLKNDVTFGTQLKHIDFIKDRIKPIVISSSDQLTKAQGIYDYVKKTIKWNNLNDFSSDDGIRKAFDNHIGNSGDINLALIAALNAATQQRQTDTYSLDLTLQNDGKFKGKIIRYSSGYSGYLKRKEIKKFNSVDEYVDNLGLKKIKILKADISNLDSLDKPLGESYEVEMSAYDNMNSDRLIFTPFFLNAIKTNPFKLAERDFPVDWGMPSDERYVINIHLPNQYAIEKIPEAVAFSMPNQGATAQNIYQNPYDANIIPKEMLTYASAVVRDEQYPYTIEYEYELKSRQSLDFTDWAPNYQIGVSVEKSTYTFICPPDFPIRYKQVNLPGDPTIGKNKDLMKTYTWQIAGLKARTDEPFSIYPEKLVTRVSVAPQKFNYYGYNGSFTNWKELGKWMYDGLLGLEAYSRFRHRTSINKTMVIVKPWKFNVSLMDDFSSINQGDHIILCLPFKNDTTWADCTSETLPFGYLGKFTDNRTVLACTPEGGKLMRTPKYTAVDNLETRKANFTIGGDGELKGTMQTSFKGAEYEDREYYINEAPAEQYKYLQNKYPINNLTIEHLDFKQEKSFDPVTIENIKLRARDYASINDGKYYFLLNPVNRIENSPRTIRNRQNDVYIARGYTDNDEITFTIPAGYRLEKTPLNTSIDKPFGKFSANITLKGNQLVYKRKLQLFDGTYSKNTYADLVDFFQSVVDDDEYSVVLVKN
eukprot:gene7441-7505_t